MTYKELLEKLQNCSEKQLACEVTIARMKTADAEDGRKEFFPVEGPVTLETSSYGLMETANGLMEDYLGCMGSEELAVPVHGLYLKAGDGIMNTNEGR